MNIKGEVSTIYCQRDAWASFVVVGKGGKKYHCAGIAQGIQKGMDVEMVADMEMHKTYGEQYKVTSCKVSIPTGSEGLVAYLSSGIIKGIGEKTAKAIVSMFGQDTINVIKKHPEKLLAIPRMSQKKVDSIVKAHEEFSMYGEVYNFANGLITPNEVNKIIDAYGKKSLKILKTNPYQIAEDIDGIGFLKADKIAMGCGVSKFSKERAAAAIKYTLDELANQGDCYVTIENLQNQTTVLLNKLPNELLNIRGFATNLYKAINDWENEKDAFYAKFKLSKGNVDIMNDWAKDWFEFVDVLAQALLSESEKGSVIIDGDTVALNTYYNAEQSVASRIDLLLNTPPLRTDRADVESFLARYQLENIAQIPDGFAPEQSESIIKSLTNRVSIITGGPGRGKTTIIRAIVSYWMELYGRDSINLCAPTGRAAQRITDGVRDLGLQALTIHKMAGINAFKPAEPLSPSSIVICDEQSMMDVCLADALLKYTKDTTIVFIGDVNQIPPVGAGNFFRDLIASNKVPTTTLVASYRNAGLIADNADRILAGNSHLIDGPDFKMEYLDRELMLDSIVKKYIEAVTTGGVDIRDACVLTLQRERGATSVRALNTAIQAAYNPDDTGKKTLKPYGFRVGDRIMQTKNNYKMEYEKDGESGLGVFNGDLGIVTAIDPDDVTLKVEFDDGRICEYGKEDLKDLILAYAMTVHKSQGSEFKLVFLTVAMDQYTMLQRAIVYTAETRAKKWFCGICEKKAFSTAVRQVGTSQRNTRLKEFLS